MSEKRKARMVCRLKIDGQDSIKIEFFPALLWADTIIDQPLEGRFRARVDGRWFFPESGANEKYFFADFPSLAARIAEETEGIASLMPAPAIDPARFAKGRVVRARAPEGGRTKTWTAGNPYQDPSGGWVVWLVGGKSMFENNPEYLERLELV